MELTRGVPGVNGPDPTTYEEFWPYYVSQHLHPATRAIHVAGTAAALVCGAVAVAMRKPVMLAVSPAVAYGPAFTSHFVIEKNRPASFGHPLWSARADFRQCWRFVTRKLEHDVRRVRDALQLHPEQRTLAEAGPSLRRVA
jgi:hypothetical protein